MYTSVALTPLIDIRGNGFNIGYEQTVGYRTI